MQLYTFSKYGNNAKHEEGDTCFYTAWFSFNRILLVFQVISSEEESQQNWSITWPISAKKQGTIGAYPNNDRHDGRADNMLMHFGGFDKTISCANYISYHMCCNRIKLTTLAPMDAAISLYKGNRFKCVEVRSVGKGVKQFGIKIYEKILWSRSSRSEKFDNIRFKQCTTNGCTNSC